MGEIVISLNRGAISTRVIQWLSLGNALAKESLSDQEDKLLAYAKDVEVRSHAIYLGTDDSDPQQRVLDVLNARVLTLPRWRDVPANGTGPAGYYEYRAMSGWDALQQYVADMRVLAQKGQNRTGMNATAQFRFVIENGATQIGPRLAVAAAEQALIAREYLRTMALAQLAILLGNAGVFVAANLYFRRLLHSVAEERLTLFNVFLAVPVRAVLETGSRPTGIPEEDEQDEDTDWLAKVKSIEEGLRRKEREKAEAAQMRRAQGGTDWTRPEGAGEGDEREEEERRSEGESGVSFGTGFAGSVLRRASTRARLGGGREAGKRKRTVEKDGSANYGAMVPLAFTGACSTGLRLR